MRFEVGNLQLFGVDLGSLAQRWKNGLQDILPQGLAQCFVRPAPAVAAVIEQNTVRFMRTHPADSTDILVLQRNELVLAADGFLKDDVLKGVKKSQLELSLVLPEEQIMRKRITLPRAARHNLRTVVSYQVGRLTPFSADQVFFDVQEVAADTVNNTIEVELIAALKTQVQPWIEHIERLTALVVSRLTVSVSADVLQPQSINLFAEQRTTNAWWLRLNRNSLLLVVLLAVLSATAVVPMLKLRAVMLERKQEIAVLNERVTGLQEKRQVLDRDLTALNYVLQQRANSRELSLIIDELTRVVPDEIFISSLSVQKQTVEITGTGLDVVSLIGLLNNSAMFENAKFTASVTRSNLGRDIFTASMQLSTAVDGQ